VPLNDMATNVLARQVGKHPVHVFTHQGQPIKQVSTRAWYHALKRAGIENFRWHDWRHTWASWHVQSGTPLFALQELAGWETERMVRRYAHLAAKHLAAYVANAQIHPSLTQAHCWHTQSEFVTFLAHRRLRLHRYDFAVLPDIVNLRRLLHYRLHQKLD
jgi:hypothetical protein